MSDPDPNGQLAASVERLNALIENRLVPLLERLAVTVERLEGRSAGAAVVDPRTSGFLAVEEALQQRDWARVAEQVDALLLAYPDDPQTTEIVERVRRRREEAAQSLQEQLTASRDTNDTETVLVLRDELVMLLDPASRHELDQDLVRWLLKIIQRRMRTGTVAPDVARLAAETAGRFGATREGASLRASLPTLRRSAGLCPRCGEPYDGVEDACDRCTGGGMVRPAMPITPPVMGDSGNSPSANP